MKKFYKIAIATLTASIMSVSALAAPQPHHFNHGHPADKHWKNDHKGPHYRPHVPPKHIIAHAPKPIFKWKNQHQLPKMYQNSAYRISAYQRYNLSKPAHHQQWYKVDGHYLLTDTKTDRIIRIVRY